MSLEEKKFVKAKI